MMLPSNLKNEPEWIFVGPMGPDVSEKFLNYPILCVDGGANFTTQMDLWVGDADSYFGEVQTKSHFKFPQDKDQSDLVLALNFFTQKLPYTFHFWGFLGGRRDHEFFNVGESLQFLEHQVQSKIMFYGENGKIYYQLLSQGQWSFQHTGLFSIGSVKNSSVRLFGQCHYPIETDTPLEPLSSRGLSNKGFGEIHLETNLPVFLYFPEGK